MKPYLIKWKDITHDNGWHDQDEMDNYASNESENTVTQVAFLYDDSENQLIFVDSWIDEGDNIQYGVIHKIPKGCIIEMIELK